MSLPRLFVPVVVLSLFAVGRARRGTKSYAGRSAADRPGPAKNRPRRQSRSLAAAHRLDFNPLAGLVKSGGNAEIERLLSDPLSVTSRRATTRTPCTCSSPGTTPARDRTGRPPAMPHIGPRGAKASSYTCGPTAPCTWPVGPWPAAGVWRSWPATTTSPRGATSRPW